LSANYFLETELGESLNDKKTYLKNGRRTQLVNTGQHKDFAVGESGSLVACPSVIAVSEAEL
jgi:hypothetical protein